MAKAITQIRKEIPNQKEEQTEAIEKVLQELGKNSEAIIQTIQILKELHDTKILETVHAILKQRTEIGAIAIHQVNQPTMRNIIKNGMNTIEFLGTLKPGQLNTILDGVGHGLERLSETGEKGEKQSLWKLRKRLWSPEIRAAMTTMVDFMDGLGEVFLRNRKESH
ncbi:MAG: hypothetical protein Q8934_04830 [Bacillota bacterium]|nr:hypothetical protein [Bacillota bacterium]